jgi:hypothetical protein
MVYKLNEKKEVRIPDKDIERLMSTMKIDQEEAVEIWLEDEGYLINDEQEMLCAKAKENKATKIVKAKKEKKQPIVLQTKKEKVVKDNPVKESVITAVAELLQGMATDVKIENKAKLVTFKIDDREFKIDLVEKRKPKTDK